MMVPLTLVALILVPLILVALLLVLLAVRALSIGARPSRAVALIVQPSIGITNSTTIHRHSEIDESRHLVVHVHCCPSVQRKHLFIPNENHLCRCGSTGLT